MFLNLSGKHLISCHQGVQRNQFQSETTETAETGAKSSFGTIRNKTFVSNISLLHILKHGYTKFLCLDLLTLTLPSSNYFTSPLSLSARNLPPLFPAISCVFYIILPSEVVAEAYTTQPNSKASSRVLYVYLACMAG